MRESYIECMNNLHRQVYNAIVELGGVADLASTALIMQLPKNEVQVILNKLVRDGNLFLSNRKPAKLGDSWIVYSVTKSPLRRDM